MEPSKESMKIIFEGQTSQIDSNTLINFLINYNTIVTVANNEIGDETKKISVKVNAPEKGSFIIAIELAQNAITELFTSDTMDYLYALTGTISSLFTIYKLLKGRPADKNEASTIMNINASKSTFSLTNSTINIYNQQPVREAISKSIEAADQDEAVEGLRIDTKRGTAISIGRQEFKDLIYADFASEEPVPSEKTVIDDNAMLGITRLYFEKGQKWGFMYKGIRIAITVRDGELMDHINKGAKFAKGDHIRVKLEILQKYNSEFRVYENTSYRILKFIEHIQPPSQTKLFENYRKV